MKTLLLTLLIAFAALGFSQEGTPEGFNHQKTVVNDVLYHYVIGGEGDPIVLLHGWPETWYLWRKIMPELADAGFTVVAPDLRGLGDSGKPETGYDARTVAGDIRALIDQLGYEQITLIGHDVGGWVAYAFANEYPEQVERLAILDVPIPDASLDQLGALTNPFTVWHFAFQEVPDLPEKLIEGQEDIYLSWFFRNFSYNPTAIGEAELNEYLRTYAAEGGLRSGFGYYRALEENVRQNEIYAQDPLQMPVLAVSGAAAMGNFVQQQMSQLATDVQGEVIEQCGHWLPSECPAQLNEQLLPFIQQ